MVSVERIRGHFADLGMSAGLASVTADDSLLLSGVLDSVGMIDLVSELERVYGISIAEDELVPEHFETLRAISDFVTHKLAGT